MNQRDIDKILESKCKECDNLICTCKLKLDFVINSKIMNEVVKTWIVNHKNGTTQMYKTREGVYYLVIPTPINGGWADVCRLIEEEEAKTYIEK